MRRRERCCCPEEALTTSRGVWGRVAMPFIDNTAPGDHNFVADPPSIRMLATGTGTGGQGTALAEFETKSVEVKNGDWPARPFSVDFDPAYTHWETTPETRAYMRLWGSWVHGYSYPLGPGFGHVPGLARGYYEDYGCIPYQTEFESGTSTVAGTLSGGWAYDSRGQVPTNYTGAVASTAVASLNVSRADLQANGLQGRAWMRAFVESNDINALGWNSEFILRPNGSGGSPHAPAAYSQLTLDQLLVDSDFDPDTETWEVSGPALDALGIDSFRFDNPRRFTCDRQDIAVLIGPGGGFGGSATYYSADMSWQNETPELRIHASRAFSGSTSANYRADAWSPTTTEATFLPNYGSNFEIGYEQTLRWGPFGTGPANITLEVKRVPK